MRNGRKSFGELGGMQVNVLSNAGLMSAAGQDGVQASSILRLHIHKVMLRADRSMLDAPHVVAHFRLLDCFQGDHRGAEVVTACAVVIYTSTAEAIDN